MPNSRDMRVDVLRVIAVSAILLHHSDDYGSQFLRATPALSVIDDVVLAYVPLASLFLISGFLAARSQRTHDRSPMAYVMRRFSRLYVPYAIALVLVKVLGIFALDWPTVGVNLLLLGPWVRDAVGTLWFVEILLYYQLVHVAWHARHTGAGRPWVLAASIVLPVVVVAALGTILGFDVDSRLLAYAPAFVIGVIVGALPTAPYSALRDAIFPATASLGIAAAAYALPVWVDVVPLGAGTAVATSIALGAYLIVSEGRGTAEYAGVATRLAYGSMMAYLSHRFVFALLSRVTESRGEAVTDATLVAAIPLVMMLGTPLQRAYDAVSGRVVRLRRN